MFVLVLLLAVAVIAVLVAIASLTFGHGRRFDDVERFHRARAMTTEWARSSSATPLLTAQHTPSDERESADA